MDEMNLIDINIQMVSQFISRHQHLDIMYIQCIAEESYTDHAINTIYQGNLDKIQESIDSQNTLLGSPFFHLIHKKMCDYERIALFSMAKVFLRSQLKSTNMYRTFEFSLSNVR